MLDAIIILVLLILSLFLIIKGNKKVDVDGATVNAPLRWIGVGILCLTLIFLAMATFRSVDAGSVSVPSTFGQVGEPLEPGVHIVAPWTELRSVNTRTQQYTMTADKGEGSKDGDDSVTVNGNDGASATIDSTVVYHVPAANASRLYKDVGTDYLDVIVRPTARKCIREAGPNQSTVELVTSKRDVFASAAQECVRASIESRGLTLESLQIRGIRVSDAIQGSINAKVSAQQDAEKKTFELAAARQEAEKSNIEKKAVSDGQQIIKCGGKVVPQENGQPPLIVPNEGASCQNQLTPEYLQWAYIDMMRSISNSPNHDTIVIPAPTTSSQAPQIQVQVPSKG